MLIIAAGLVWWFATHNLAPYLAEQGFSPTYFIANLRHPDWFARGYPSGAEEFLKSAPMFIYITAGAISIPLVLVMKVMIALEIICIAAASIWAARVLWPLAPTITYLVTAIFLICSNLFAADLGRWGFPGYGWVYSFAYAGVLVGAAAALESRLVVCAVALAFAFAAHAVLGLFGLVFVAIILLMDVRRLSAANLVRAGLVFALLAGGWFVFVAATSNLGSGGIPDEAFVSFTRLMSVHWYPVDMGLFWENNTERFLPFLSSVGLLLAYLPAPDGSLTRRDQRAAAGFLALLLLTAVGVYVSVNVASPFLIKLALHRASGVLVVLSALYVVPGLWRDATSGSVLRSVAATLAFVGAFFETAGVPILIVGILGASFIAEDIYSGKWTFRATLLCSWSAVIAALLAFYTAQGMSHWMSPAYSGHFFVSKFWALAMLALLGYAISSRYFRLQVPGILMVFVLLTIYWAKVHALLPKSRDLARAQDYMAAQLWARDHTPVGTLFMPDPSHYYGWREFSLRPSFGNLREWLHSGWIYNSNVRFFNEGIRRVAALGIDPWAYTKSSANGIRPPNLFPKLSADVQRRYYGMKASEFLRFSREFGISYFVFEKVHGLPPKKMLIDYQNANYVIASVRPKLLTKSLPSSAVHRP